MKEKYEKPIIALNEYETRNIITTSEEIDTPAWGGEIVENPPFPDMG